MMVLSIVAVLAAAAVALAPAANAAAGCRVTYTVYGTWPGTSTRAWRSPTSATR